MKLVFVDCETTSLAWDRRAFEIALIRRDDDGETVNNLWVADADMSDANPDSLRINRYFERVGRTRLPSYRDHLVLSEAQTAGVVESVTADAVLVGSNPDFDAHTLAMLLRRWGYLPRWQYRTLDVVTLAAGQVQADVKALQMDLLDEDKDVDVARITASIEELKAASTPPYRSETLSRLCGVALPSAEERHTAMGDARWVQRWYDALVPP